MEYTHKIEIDLSPDQVIANFDNEENLKHWQKGFVSMEHLSGEKGEAGSTAKLTHNMRNRDIEMIETIISKDLPEALHITFDAKNVRNIQEHHFEELPNGRRVWSSKNKFKLGGLIKSIGFLTPGAFKKQSISYIRDFKAFAEEGKSVILDS